MRHRLLIAGGVLVAVLLAALVWVVRPRRVAPTSMVTAAPEPLAPAPPLASAPSLPAPVPVPAPAAPASAPAPPTEPAAPEREVHDHSGEAPPPRSPLGPDTIVAVRVALTPLVKACAQSLPGGTAGQVTVIAQLKISSGQLSATAQNVVHGKFKDEALDACVQKAIGELALAAPAGQIDTTYRVVMPFTVP